MGALPCASAVTRTRIPVQRSISIICLPHTQTRNESDEVYEAYYPFKRCRVASRELKLLDRMDSLLAQQAEQRELEHQRHLDREKHLLSQIDMLLHHVGNAHPENALPVRSAQAGRPPGGRTEFPSPAPCIAQAVSAIQAGSGSESRGTFDDLEPDCAGSEVLQAMNAVRDGADVLSNEDLSSFAVPVGLTRGGDGGSGGKEGDARVASLQPAGPTAAAVAVGGGGGGGAAEHAQASTPSAYAAASTPQAATAPVTTSTTPIVGNDAAAEQIPVEMSKAPPDGPPPLLKQGDDDIFWVSELHVRCCSAVDDQ